MESDNWFDTSDPTHWPVKKLKDILHHHNVDTTSCIEKPEFIDFVVRLQKAQFDVDAAQLPKRNTNTSIPVSSSSPSSSSASNPNGAPSAASFPYPTDEFDKQDLYELLGVDKTAAAADIKKAYYKVARECHPDKAGGDPRSEAKFKAVSMAYEVLSDPQKREWYDKHGHEGLAAGGPMKPTDIKPVIRAVFGGGNFMGIFGDVCTLPALKSMLEHFGGAATGEDKEASTDPAVRRKEMMQAREEEEKLCKELSVFLEDKLNKFSADGWIGTQTAEAELLAESPGGTELLERVSYVYIQEARQYLGGIFGFFSELQEKAHFAVEGVGVFASAIGLFRKAKDLERKQLQSAGIDPTKEISEAERVKIGLKGRNVEEVRMLEAELMEEGLSTVWKLGKLLVEERVRKVCELIMEDAKKNNKADVLGKALLKLGEIYEEKAMEMAKKKSFDLHNHIIQQAAQANDEEPTPRTTYTQ